ncbi:GGDEF domain-containing protein [Acetobacterium wieringae]|uniref:Putative diguanylate cyclase YdaM n=1 Tax=Acetobacterium wieringae TaxID=52694 RepID=A0A1F2PMM9_9FIRM|nr:diguanylate cyclase [Acetobacterium wieringae]OFV71991.1 putative diguanylate cyclase YdaM [Acetobacterium wieringae]
MNETINKELIPFQKHFDAFITAYLTERDLNKTASLFAESFLGFGTGLAERTYTKAEAMLLFQQDIESAPNPIAVTFHQKQFLLLDADNALVAAELDMKTVILEQRVKFNNLRLLLVMHRNQDTVAIVGMHLSFPTDVHGDEESFPLKELEERAHLLQEMVEKRTKSLKQAYDELSDLINRDRLTKVASRHYFEEALLNEQRRFKNFQRNYALILLDIDDFKQINDMNGHLIGDDILKTVAATISNIARKTDVVARWGGDEFVILLPETGVDTAYELAEAMRQAVENGDYPITLAITLSIGISGSRADDHARNVFKLVDDAMYRAKKTGKNQIVCV